MKNLKLKNEDSEFLSSRLKIEDPMGYLYFPKYVEIETIRGCNSRCTMCPLSEDDTYKKGRMGGKLFSKIVNEISEYSDWIHFVCLSRNGEPLLDKGLPERVKQLKDAGIKRVTFSTNASLLDKNMGERLIVSGLDEIRFSIDGYTKETYEAIRRGLDYETVVENCLRFIDLRNKYGSNLQIQARLTEQERNADEIISWRDFWTSILKDSDIVASKKMHSWGNRLKNYEGEKIEYPGPCISPFSTFESFYDGVVPLCGCDYKPEYVLGNLNESSIKEVWQSDSFEKIRHIHIEGNRSKIPICDKCNIWDTENVRTIWR